MQSDIFIGAVASSESGSSPDSRMWVGLPAEP